MPTSEGFGARLRRLDDRALGEWTEYVPPSRSTWRALGLLAVSGLAIAGFAVLVLDGTTRQVVGAVGALCTVGFGEAILARWMRTGPRKRARR